MQITANFDVSLENTTLWQFFTTLLKTNVLKSIFILEDDDWLGNDEL